MLGKNLCEDHLDALLRERDGEVEVLSVLRHRRQVGFQLPELLAQLARAIRPEVEEEGAVARGIERRRVRPPQRHDELVRDAGVVAPLDELGCGGAVGLSPLVEDRVEGEPRALPALVAVHRVVAAGDGRDPLVRKLG